MGKLALGSMLLLLLLHESFMGNGSKKPTELTRVVTTGCFGGKGVSEERREVLTCVCVELFSREFFPAVSPVAVPIGTAGL